MNRDYKNSQRAFISKYFKREDKISSPAIKIYGSYIEGIIDEICIETGINKISIRLAIYAMFKATKIALGNWNTPLIPEVRWIYVGSFQPSKLKFKKYLKIDLDNVTTK